MRNANNKNIIFVKTTKMKNDQKNMILLGAKL